MKKLIFLLIARILAVLCMLGVPALLLYTAYDAFMEYNEDGMSLMEGFGIFALGGAFVFFTFIIWVLAIEMILCEPNKNEDKKNEEDV